MGSNSKLVEIMPFAEDLLLEKETMNSIKQKQIYRRNWGPECGVVGYATTCDTGTSCKDWLDSHIPAKASEQIM